MKIYESWPIAICSTAETLGNWIFSPQTLVTQYPIAKQQFSIRGGAPYWPQSWVATSTRLATGSIPSVRYHFRCRLHWQLCARKQHCITLYIRLDQAFQAVSGADAFQWNVSGIIRILPLVSRDGSTLLSSTHCLGTTTFTFSRSNIQCLAPSAERTKYAAQINK